MRTIRTRRPFLAFTTAVALIGLAPAAPAAARDEHPCAMLALRDVRSVYPDAHAGVPDLKLARHGIFRCTWKHRAGTLLLVTGSADDTVADEAESWALTILDPLRSDAARHLRYETIRGVGTEAVAVVERKDDARGLMQDGAYISVRLGATLVTLLAPDLARGDRADALRKLTQLARDLAVTR
jgi:hypothetical protein